jgi:hypothetical protein
MPECLIPAARERALHDFLCEIREKLDSGASTIFAWEIRRMKYLSEIH